MNTIKQNTQNSFNYNDLLKMIPILGTIFIVYGIIYAKGYYSYFDIKITDYLSFTEAVTLFIDEIQKVMLATIITTIFFIGFIMLSNSINLEKNIFGDSLISHSPKFKKTIKIVFFIFAPISSLSLIIFPNFIYGIIPLIILSILGFVFYFNSDFNCGLKHFFIYTIIFFIPLSFSGAVFNLGRNDAENFTNICKKTESNKGGIYILYKDSLKNKMNNSKNNIYLGKTSSYLFIYKTQDSISLIIPIEEVEELRIKNIPK